MPPKKTQSSRRDQLHLAIERHRNGPKRRRNGMGGIVRHQQLEPLKNLRRSSYTSPTPTDYNSIKRNVFISWSFRGPIGIVVDAHDCGIQVIPSAPPRGGGCSAHKCSNVQKCSNESSQIVNICSQN